MPAPPLLVVLIVLQGAAPSAVADSARIHGDMVAAQRLFESTRRRLLPVTTAGAGRCDVRIGRFCYWYDPTEPPPPAEPARIREARARLLRLLADAQAAQPGNDWILGQRVRYLVEQGATDSALAAVRGCARWWCEALAGFTYHARGEVANAEPAFDAALAAMPPDTRCVWNDLAVALEDRDREAYRRLDCRGRDSANALLFFRATPLLARPGNDVRSEWLARHTLVQALEGAVTHHGSHLGPDLRELILRYGWATAYGRRPDRYGDLDAGIDVVGHEPRPAYPFLANERPGRWPPDAERPRARFAPVFAAAIQSLEDAQLAAFRRGDSVVLVAGLSLRADTLFQGRGVTTWLSLRRDPGSPPVRTSGQAPEGRSRLLLAAPYLWGLVSLEAHDSTARAWAVRRLDLLLPERISSLLLTVPGDSLPASLEAAAGQAWPGVRVPEGGRVGLFWESYGHAETDTIMDVSVTIAPSRPGFVARLGQSLGLGKRVTPLRLAWARDRRPGADQTSHAVELDLSRLSRGGYDLTVEMPGRRTSARLEIVPGERLARRLEPERPRDH